MKSLNLIFMGSPDFAVPSLEELYRSNHHISAVVSNPDKRRARRSKPKPTVVKQKAVELGLTTIDVEDLHSDEFRRKLAQLKPDLLVIVAFRILPSTVLEIPKIGSINLHASLLPKYRGAAPIHWAVINGERETGCTIFFLDEKVDTGKIISREKTEIGPLETTGDIYERLKYSGAKLLADSVNRIAEGKVRPVSQNHVEATSAPKLFRDNTKIDFSKSAREVHNFVRGLNPFPVAWCRYGDEKLNIYSTVPKPDKNLSPGSLTLEGNRLFVGCGRGAVEVVELQLPGTKVMSGREFANGYSLEKTLR